MDTFFFVQTYMDTFFFVQTYRADGVVLDRQAHPTLLQAQAAAIGLWRFHNGHTLASVPDLQPGGGRAGWWVYGAEVPDATVVHVYETKWGEDLA